MKKIILVLSLFIISSCSEDDASLVQYYLPFMTTNTPQNVSINQATISGHIELAPLSAGDGIDGNSNEIESKGFIWGVNEDLSLENGTKIEFNSNPGNYRATLENLSQDTKYYFNTYAINANNQSELGIQQSFTTAKEASCDYQTDNYLQPIYEYYDEAYLPDSVTLTDPISFGDGNIEFTASSNNSIIRILIQLNEIDSNLPLSGTYSGVYNFNNSSPSSNEMKITIQDYNGIIDFYPQGAVNNEETEIYIQNAGGNISFIFCDITLGEYLLTGKFSYQIP